MYTRPVLVCHGTKRLTAQELVSKTRTHVSMMTGNPHFPDPMPSLAEVTEACDELDIAAQVYAFNHGRMDLNNRNTSYQRVRQLVILLAIHVQNRCKNDRAIALSAGFETKRKRSPSQPTGTPANVRAASTAYPGSIALRWNAVKARKVYSVWMTERDPQIEEGWQLVEQTSRNFCTIADLERFKTYTFRVMAIGVLGHGAMSDIAIATTA